MEQPPSIPDTPYHRLGGPAVFEAIATRFYDLMEGDPAYAELRAMHAPDLTPMRASLPKFLIAWAGGPRDWFEQNPGRCMMSLHAPFTIEPLTANQWADAIERAIADVGPEPADVARSMSEVLARIARSMGR